MKPVQKPNGTVIGGTSRAPRALEGPIRTVVFACDAGMGSSAMGATRFRKRIEPLGSGVRVTNSSVDTIPEGTDVVVVPVAVVAARREGCARVGGDRDRQFPLRSCPRRVVRPDRGPNQSIRKPSVGGGARSGNSRCTGVGDADLQGSVPDWRLWARRRRSVPPERCWLPAVMLTGNTPRRWSPASVWPRPIWAWVLPFPTDGRGEVAHQTFGNRRDAVSRRGRFRRRTGAAGDRYRRCRRRTYRDSGAGDVGARRRGGAPTA